MARGNITRGVECIVLSFPRLCKFIAAVHKTSAKGWAEERGFLYLQAQNDEELTEAMKTFTQPETMEQPVLLEVFTNKNKDARMLKNYYHQLKQK